MVVTGWPLASRLYKEFNISKCKESTTGTTQAWRWGLSCGIFLHLVIGKRHSTLPLRPSFTLTLLCCGMKCNNRYRGVLICSFLSNLLLKPPIRTFQFFFLTSQFSGLLCIFFFFFCFFFFVCFLLYLHLSWFLDALPSIRKLCCLILLGKCLYNQVLSLSL